MIRRHRTSTTSQSWW